MAGGDAGAAGAGVHGVLDQRGRASWRRGSRRGGGDVCGGVGGGVRGWWGDMALRRAEVRGGLGMGSWRNNWHNGIARTITFPAPAEGGNLGTRRRGI